MQLNDILKTFPHTGSFRFGPGEQIRGRVREENVPNLPGVYLIYACQGSERELIYIGMAGTMKQDGQFKSQGLCGRLCAKAEGGIPRQVWLQQDLIRDLGIDALHIEWYVTFSEDVRVLPAKVEADLIQAFFQKHQCLPLKNSDF